MNLDDLDRDAPTILPLADPHNLKIEVRSDIAWKPSDEQQAAWQARCDANPRLFDGRLLSADTWLAPTLVVHAATYQQFITAQTSSHRVTQLGVTGMLIAADHTGSQRLLLGLRSRNSGIYPGMWELAPAGGVPAPARAPAAMDISDIHEALRLEAAEELGLHLPTPITPRLLCYDPHAPSLDIVCEVRLPSVSLDRLEPPAASHPNWEYERAAWIECSVDAIEAWLSHQPTIAPSAAIMRWLAAGTIPPLH